MDPRLLKYYNRELQFMREMGGEFAKEFPKIAGRLGIEGFECADPYVERLLEGFGFLAARVQLKIDAEFPRFTQHLLEMVYPHYLAPTPSMAVVELKPELKEGALAEGLVVPRGSVLLSVLGKGDRTACEYRTAHDLTLWPIEITEASYITNTRAFADFDVPRLREVRAGLRLRFRAAGGVPFSQLPLDRLPLFLRGGEETPWHLYEQLFANSVAMVVRPVADKPAWHEVVTRDFVRRVGFEDGEALLPHGPRSFHGYRLLQEYFAFPDRFMFVELAGLGPAVRRCEGHELEVVVLLDRAETTFEKTVDRSYFALYCTPVVNLFPKRADRIHLSARQNEYHVVPDRTRPMDFEVYEVTGATGFGTSADPEQEFLPFYALNDVTRHGEHLAYYTVRREPRRMSSRQRAKGPRSSHIGSEVFVALVDANEAPYRSDLRQLSVTTLCTNRDLPLLMPVGKGKTDFTLEMAAPVTSVRCVAGPTKPKPSAVEGEIAWRVISHLSLNYLSLLDDDETGAAALRELLMLYGDTSEPAIRKQIEGVRSVSSRPINRRLPIPGPICFGRGLEITVSCDESGFEGTGLFLLGAVLEQFFAKYVSINSFTETVIRSLDRGEVMRWPARIGRRHTL